MDDNKRRAEAEESEPEAANRAEVYAKWRVIANCSADELELKTLEGWTLIEYMPSPYADSRVCLIARYPVVPESELRERLDALENEHRKLKVSLASAQVEQRRAMRSLEAERVDHRETKIHAKKQARARQRRYTALLEAYAGVEGALGHVRQHFGAKAFDEAIAAGENPGGAFLYVGDRRDLDVLEDSDPETD